MNPTSIEWVNCFPGRVGRTWNPLRGCRRISTGCERCYAEHLAAVRLSGPGRPYEGLVDERGRWNGQTRSVPEKLLEPLRERRPAAVFVESMSDLFFDGFANDEIAAVFAAMATSPHHLFLVLTKRAMRMHDFVLTHGAHEIVEGANRTAPHAVWEEKAWPALSVSWPLPNVWLGVSAEDQARADERIPELLATAAPVRFVSYEPALGGVDFLPYLRRCHLDRCLAYDPVLSWLIAGSESGPGARPADLDWFRSARDQCVASGVPFLLKQLPARWPGSKKSLPELDGQVWAQTPDVGKSVACGLCGASQSIYRRECPRCGA